MQSVFGVRENTREKEEEGSWEDIEVASVDEEIKAVKPEKAKLTSKVDQKTIERCSMKAKKRVMKKTMTKLNYTCM